VLIDIGYTLSTHKFQERKNTMTFDHYATFRTESGLSLLCDSFPGWEEHELILTECEKGTDGEGKYWTQYFESSEKIEAEKCREIFYLKDCIDAKFNMVLRKDNPEFNSEGDVFLDEE